MRLPTASKKCACSSLSRWFESKQTMTSDYDRKDERHWLPGEGVIDWPDFLRRLQASGYKGVFMHEVRAGVNATPENVVKAYKEVILGKMKK